MRNSIRFSHLHPLLLLLLLTSVLNCSGVSSPTSHPQAQVLPQRIISLAPSITEVLFALGLADRVVGVTRYCDYPHAAREKAEIGGYFDVNYEAVMVLDPDIAIHIKEHEDARARLSELGVQTLSVDHSGVQGILESITTIAERCGIEEKGNELRISLEERISMIQKNVSFASPRPRVLVTVGRSLRTGESGEIYVSGRDGFYDDLIRLAGGKNAYREETLKFPVLSSEGLARLDPDIIIEMIPEQPADKDRNLLLARWESIPGLTAVREGRVHIIAGDHVVVPGPRFIDLLENMVEIIHGKNQNRENGK